MGGWVGPRASLDAVVKKKIVQPVKDFSEPVDYTFLYENENANHH
jgi:hypothetical protein